MKTHRKVWLVNKLYPSHVQHITVLVGDRNLLNKLNPKEYKQYDSAREALEKAFELQKVYKAKQVKLFYSNGILDLPMGSWRRQEHVPVLSPV